MLPSNLSTSVTAGRTTTIVDDPVIPNTVHISAISAYHFGVYLGGMGFGAKNLSRNVVDCWLLSFTLLLFHRLKIMRLFRCAECSSRLLQRRVENIFYCWCGVLARSSCLELVLVYLAVTEGEEREEHQCWLNVGISTTLNAKLAQTHHLTFFHVHFRPQWRTTQPERAAAATTFASSATAKYELFNQSSLRCRT